MTAARGGDSGKPNKARTTGNSSGSGFYSAFRTKLEQLSFHSFQNCVVLWLGAKGYRNIEWLGRRFPRGRRSAGGADLLARLKGSEDVRVAIAIKHWRTPVQRRSVDELRGYMLKEQIPFGLIVASSEVFPAARRAGRAYVGRPVKLISVAQLAGSMAGLGLGVLPPGNRIDEGFFRSLEHLRFGSDPDGSPRAARSCRNGWLRALAGNSPQGEAPNGYRPKVWVLFGVALAFLLLFLWTLGVLR